ncbi:hypothetical protein [Bradyrhizobium sp. LTSP857]|uniref:hypothetical protein n=1 Tax=Bradyrhizobium sp. LTSP857 TaxID=1619231 RepID=UPI0005D27466|nr:hypothetical protein [Bradyrhizobium sp. LTSP857]KJC44509.1 hypothetical protein UP06_18745 [Bradyrhizobium sp. LTSP857]
MKKSLAGKVFQAARSLLVVVFTSQSHPSVGQSNDALRQPTTAETATPEQELGSLIKRNWVMTKLAGDCLPGQLYADRVKCLSRYGASIEVTYPDECRITVVERRSLPSDVPRKWDGSIDGSLPVAREATVDLRSLNETRISLKPTVNLGFDLTKSNMPTLRAAMSDRPNAWVTLPPPPLEADLVSAYPDAVARRQALFAQERRWYDGIQPYAGGELLQSIDLSSSGLQVRMSALGILFPPQQGFNYPAIEQRVIGTLKALLAKCHR